MTIELRKHSDAEGRCFLFQTNDHSREFEVKKRGMWGNRDAAKFNALVDDYVAKLESGGHAVSLT